MIMGHLADYLKDTAMPNSNRTGAGACYLALIAASLALWPPQTAHAWGTSGHRIVAEIAERHIEPGVRAKITELIEGRSLPEISNWADDVRSYPVWDCAQSFHYVTIEPGAEYPDQGVPEGDVIEAVVYYADVLADQRADLESRRVALKFLVHLVGDLHQPLHVGRGCDRGGNRIKVDWFGETANFHTVWDSGLIDSENLSFTEFADFADHATTEQITAYQDSTPLDWAREAQELLDGIYSCDVRGDGCPCFCGDCDDGLSPFGGCLRRECTLIAAGPARLSYRYRTRSLPIIHSQVVKGGARLAGMLSWILSENQNPPKAYRQMRKRMRKLPNWDQAQKAMASCDGSP